MQLLYPFSAVVHIHGDLLPCVETQIPFFQKDLILAVVHRFDDLHDVTLQIHQAVNVVVDLLLQVNDFAHGICHRGAAVIGVSRHTRQRGGAFGGKLIQRS